MSLFRRRVAPMFEPPLAHGIHHWSETFPQWRQGVFDLGGDLWIDLTVHNAILLQLSELLGVSSWVIPSSARNSSEKRLSCWKSCHKISTFHRPPMMSRVISAGHCRSLRFTHPLVLTCSRTGSAATRVGSILLYAATQHDSAGRDT